MKDTRHELYGLLCDVDNLIVDAAGIRKSLINSSYSKNDIHKLDELREVYDHISVCYSEIVDYIEDEEEKKQCTSGE